ncbi:MAG: hypothetical protein SFY80_10665 [Verrucomicrobiota bacterium]|nr:hypothetical protein [Verrucomicrobiota bacterium]
MTIWFYSQIVASLSTPVAPALIQIRRVATASKRPLHDLDTAERLVSRELI